MAQNILENISTKILLDFFPRLSVSYNFIVKEQAGGGREEGGRQEEVV